MPGRYTIAWAMTGLNVPLAQLPKAVHGVKLR